MTGVSKKAICVLEDKINSTQLVNISDNKGWVNEHLLKAADPVLHQEFIVLFKES